MCPSVAKLFDVANIDRYENVFEWPDVNMIASFTQRHLYGDIVLRALPYIEHFPDNYKADLTSSEIPPFYYPIIQPTQRP